MTVNILRDTFPPVFSEEIYVAPTLREDAGTSSVVTTVRATDQDLRVCGLCVLCVCALSVCVCIVCVLVCVQYCLYMCASGRVEECGWVFLLYILLRPIGINFKQYFPVLHCFKRRKNAGRKGISLKAKKYENDFFKSCINDRRNFVSIQSSQLSLFSDYAL